MYMIEITEDKYSELAENAEKMLKYGGKVMSCLDSMKGEIYGERTPMPDYRGRGHNSRSNMRGDDDEYMRRDYGRDDRRRDNDY